MKSYFKLAIRILALCLLFSLAVLTPSTEALAQEACQDLNELMNFDYRTWGIGTHRDCGSCDFYDAPCLAELAYCAAMKEKQILLGFPVEQWIIASHNAAVNASLRPIPDRFKEQLSALYPESILGKVRYTTDSSFIGTLQWFRDEMGQEGAITLVDIIVFRNDQLTTDLKIWAHELEHVRQYDQLGVDGFAQAYVDQTCILPGEAGYGSGRCQIEWMAKRKSAYWDKRGLVACCAMPATLELHDGELSEKERFIARDSITVGANVTLRANDNVKLIAGRVITMSPNFRSEPGGKLYATIDPSLNQSCPMPSVAATSSQKKSP
jgi:hypothetical protein